MEIAGRSAVDEDAAKACGVVTAYGVVFSIDARIVDGVLVEVGHRVKLYWRDIAQQTVYLPSPHTLGHFFVTA